MVGFSTIPAAGEGILTHLYMCHLFPPKWKLCLRHVSLR